METMESDKDQSFQLPQEKNCLETSEIQIHEEPSLSSPIISKRQQKRVAKREMWLAQKNERRAKEKEKRKRKLQEAHERGIKLGPGRKELKMSKMENSSCQIRVAVDMSFCNLMTDTEMSKAFKQLHRCYYLNRRAKAPMQFYITSATAEVKQKMSVNAGCLNWDVYYREESHLDVFGRENIIYMTSESENVLEKLEESKAYIIGGLVDHNRHKGVCHRMAVEKNTGHARLPIDKFLTMKTRSVLTIDQVFHTLLKVTEGVDWGDAFLEVLPKRKGAVIKDVSQDVTEHKYKDSKLILDI